MVCDMAWRFGPGPGAQGVRGGALLVLEVLPSLAGLCCAEFRRGRNS